MTLGLADILLEGARRLQAAGCDNPKADIRALVADVIGKDALENRGPRTLLTPKEHRAVEARVRRRIRREPLEYILGCAQFRELSLYVDKRVHIPHEPTGILVDIALEQPQGASVHDIGTGSGAVALAIKSKRPDLAVSGSDASEAAVEVARRNALQARLDVRFFVAEGYPGGRFDLAVGCLPYAPEDTLEQSHPPEIAAHQPKRALVAGTDGLDVIRSVLAGTPPGTPVALEHLHCQAQRVAQMLGTQRQVADASGLFRVTVGVTMRHSPAR